jgi:hypothetical protein
MRQSATLYTKIVKATEISSETIRQMHDLFIEYYNNAHIENFINDLRKKDHIILVCESFRNRVVGFTTIKKIDSEFQGKKVSGIFSGDTIMYKEYWGSKAMHSAFFGYLIKEKLKNPSVSLYWFLISKGYKTYLLMANGFKRYYPSIDGEESDQKYLKALTKHFCDMSYPGKYNYETGILDFGDTYQNLKEDVAEITPELKKQYPKIDFFEEMNPGWRKGNELACIGELSFDQFAFYAMKLSKSVARKRLSKIRKKLLPAPGV